MSRGRRLLVLGAGAILVVAVALVATALLIPSERVAAAVAARAESMLGQRVAIEDVGLRFVPLPGVRLEGISVGGTDAESALAVVDGVELRARILPLLRGDVIISSIALDRPRIVVDIDSAGRSNLPILEPDTTGEPEPGAARDIRFAIDRVAVNGGRIGFRDARDGSVLRLDGWDQQLRLAGDVRDGQLGRIELEGWLEFDDVDARLPRVVIPVQDLAVRVSHQAELDRAADRLRLGSLEVALGGVTLEGAGTVDSVSSATGRTAEATLRADGIDAGALTTWLPDSLRARIALPDGRPIEPEGHATLDLAVDGPLTPGALPAFAGTLALADVAARVDGEALLEAVRGETAFSADSAIGRFSGRLLGEQFTATFAARDPAAPLVDLSFDGRADLTRLAALGLLPDTLELRGGLRADLAASLPARDLSAATVTGVLGLEGVALAGAETPVAVPAGLVRFRGRALTVDSLRVRAGDADLAITATAEGWIPALIDSAAAPPRVAADVRAGDLDLDALLGPSESEYPPLLFARLQGRSLDGAPPEEAAQAAGLRLPALPSVDGEVRFRAARVVRNSLTYSDLDATLRIRDDSLVVTDATFGFMDGLVRAAGRFVPTELDSAGAPARARMTAEFALDSVQAGSFFDRLTPFRDHLAGTLDLAGSVDMDLDRNALPDRTTLGADGTLALSQGRLANWEVLRAVAGRLGLAALDTVHFRDWAGAFRVTGSRVALEETALDGALISGRAAGSFGFDGNLDLGATLYLTRELAARAGRIGEQVMAAAGSGDRIPVGLSISGPARSPEVSLDLSDAREAVVARAREQAEREARELAGRAADAAMDRLEIPDSLRGLSADSLRKVVGDSLSHLLPDSLRLQPDSLRTRAEDEIRDRLRRIFPD